MNECSESCSFSSIVVGSWLRWRDGSKQRYRSAAAVYGTFGDSVNDGAV
jgi:hypothetical protein